MSNVPNPEPLPPHGAPEGAPRETARAATPAFAARPYLVLAPPAPPVGADAAAAAGPPRARRGAARVLAELLVAIAITLACYGLLLVVMGRLLPSSTGIGDLLRAARLGGAEGAGSAAANHELRTSGRAGTVTRWLAAALTVVDDEVMRKESSSIAWAPVHDGTPVAEGDGVQTTRQGMAVVKFDARSSVRIGRNSLVMLRRLETEESPDASSPVASMQLVSGELWGSVAGRDRARVRVEVGPDAKRTVIEAGGGAGAPAQFRVAARPDGSSSIAVFAGDAHVQVAERAVTLKAHEYVLVGANGSLSDVRRQADPPALAQPADRARVAYRDIPARVAFRWAASAGASGYRVTVARDSSFREVVRDDATTDTGEVLGTLAAGEYWWHVSAVASGVDGAPSAARRLHVSQDASPPALDVDPPPARVAAASTPIRGRAEPGSTVFVDGVRVPVRPDGVFQCDAGLKPGMNLVIVEALDEAGNASYRSHEVQRTLVHPGQETP